MSGHWSAPATDGAAPRHSVSAEALVSGTRWMLAGLGIFCFALGAVGTVVPGLPTTVFLLGGSYCLVRSCPALERRLREHPVFRRYAVYLDEAAPLPAGARKAALTGMWTSIALSSALLAWRGFSPMLVGAVLGAGLVGTAAILRFRRHLDA